MSLADRHPRLRRLSLLILLVGAVVVYFGFIAPNVTKKHDVTIHLNGPIHEVTRIDTAWTRIEGGGQISRSDDSETGSSQYFRPGEAPRETSTAVHAASGEYWLSVDVLRGPRLSSSRQRVILDGDTKVFVTVGDE